MQALFESMRVPDAELDARIERALDPEYWQALVPGLVVCGAPAPELTPGPPLAEAAHRAAAAHLQGDRYVRLSQLLPLSLTARMHAGVNAVLAADWPAVFTWMYDEFWRVPRIPPLVQLVSGMLGEGYLQTPYVWTNLVSEQRGADGWPPHVDNPGPDARVTMWIPLSEATLETGCISLIPPNAIPKELQDAWHDRESFNVVEMKRLLQATIAFESHPGDVLAWDARIIHWGAPRQSSGAPRVSLSMEFITAAGESTITSKSIPVTSDGPLPSHEDRLRLIARGIVDFNRRELRTSRYEGLARRMLQRLGE